MNTLLWLPAMLHHGAVVGLSNASAKRRLKDIGLPAAGLKVSDRDTKQTRLHSERSGLLQRCRGIGSGRKSTPGPRPENPNPQPAETETTMWAWPNDLPTSSLAAVNDELLRYDPDRGMKELKQMWRLQKGEKPLLCWLFTHPLGWELRAESNGEFARSLVCKRQSDVFRTADEWKAEAIQRGWME